MQAINKIGFKDIMFVYATRSSRSRTIDVLVPDAFVDKETAAKSINVFKSNDIFINIDKPNVSNSNSTMNYLTLPVMNSIDINNGDRLIASFINSNPLNGIVIGK